MKKIRFFCAILFAFCFVYAGVSFREETAYAMTSSARGCAVVESSSKRVLFSQNKDKRMPMASTTKIMTAITAIENCENLDEKFVVSKKAVGVPGTSLYLREGDEYSTRDLLYALMLISGNDASVAIAEHVAGSTSEFVTKMNDLSKKIGVKNTHFANTHGLDADGHYTTAYDLAVITSYALENPVFREIVSTKNMKITNGQGDCRFLKNKNKLLFTLDGCIGVKTGFTDDAGRCLVSAIDKDGMIVVCVVLNCGPMFQESEALLRECAENYKMHDLTTLYDFDNVVNVVKGSKPTAHLGTFGHFFYPLTDKEVESLRFVYEYPDEIVAPMRKKTEVGTVQIFLGNDLLFSEKIYTIEDVRPRSILQRIGDFFENW
ncbi:MAG: D-alanyl-D-alanine carboxypeptidase [Clostridia bacterium]|nr:D-alanyl-D-alanine carboxypeptidase [Clostridia bacterium]